MLALLTLASSTAGAVAKPAATNESAALDRGLDQVISDYVRTALHSTLALQEQEISYQRRLEALADARGAYLPSVSLEGRITRADGGRSIDVPIGAVVNPIYATLNQLTRNTAATHSAPP